MSWKYLKLLIFSVLICLQITVADASLLPQRFPKDFNSPEKIEVLKKWIGLTKSYSFYNFHVDKSHLNGHTWMNVYYELQFSIFDKRDLNELEEQIESMLKIYNSAGFKIGVVFSPYIQILDLYGNSLSTFGKKKITAVDRMWLHVPAPEDPVWWRHGMNGANSYFNTSFVLLEENIGYINLRNQNSLPHELNHLLFQHKDAYKKTSQLSDEESNLVCNLNAKHCRSAIHPLEIYIGLKRYGHIAPQWNNYVDRTYVFQDMAQQKLQIYSEKNPINNNGDLFLKFYSMNGKVVGDFRYCTKNCNPQDILVPHIPNVIDLDFLEPGAYMVDATIVQHGNDIVFGNPIFTNSHYQNAARIFVEPN